MYLAHKAARIKGADNQIPLREHPALLLSDSEIIESFQNRYESTSNLYYNGQPEFKEILERIKIHLSRYYKIPYAMKKHLFTLLIGLLTSNIWAQFHFVTNGNAKRLTTDSLFELTEDKNLKSGSIWCSRRIDLRHEFTIYAKMHFGNKRFGADGIAFLLQNMGINALSNAVDGIGYKDIKPSLDVEFDTYDEYNEFYDHVSIERNGRTGHSYDPIIGGHTTTISSNLADNKWHSVVFHYDPHKSCLFTIKFDNVSLAGHNFQGCIVFDSIFQKSPYVYFGFTSSTSKRSNRHQVMIDSFDVLFENECKIYGNNQYKTWNQCWNDSSTLNVLYSPPVGIHSKIKWFNGDTTAITRFKFNSQNPKVWVQISNALGICKDSGIVNIIKPDLNLLDIIDSSCVSQSITVKVPGFSSYLWNNGNNKPSLQINTEGKYSLKVIDAYGCKANDSFTFTRKQMALKIDSVWKKNVSCFGYVDGQAGVITTNKPWQKINYFWSPLGTKTAKITHLKAGEYTVKVIDSNQCADSLTITITEPKRLQLQSLLTENVLCKNTPTGLAEIKAIGGTPSYNFSWYPKTLGTSSKATDLYSGIYKAFVTDQNGCGDTLQISITEPDKLHLKVTGFRGDCAGDKKGYIECLTQGGTQGYFWKLDPSKSPIEKEADGLHSAFRNLPAGKYRVTVTDKNNCTDTAWQTVAAVPKIDLTFDTLIDIKTGNWTQLNANIYPAGNYIYNWTPIDSFRGQSNEKSPRIRAFNHMKVQLYIMDSNGCTQQNAFSLNTIDPLLTCFIPTAFTPDGNSLNEGFAPVGEFDRAVFEIYNRWGQLIFKSSSDQPYWDGNYQSQPAPEGVYIIRADIYWTGIRKKQYHSGKFQLLR
ncbi:MAG: hypothetical protein RLZ77_1857 [Bacteroidota bacterium]